MKAIAALHGIHRVTVSQVLERTGTAKGTHSTNPSQVDTAARLYERGLSLASTVTQLGFNATTIRAVLLRRGVATRDAHARAH